MAARDAPDSTPTVEQALHATLELPFDEAVDAVQLEHELAGFETIKTTRMDRLVTWGPPPGPRTPSTNWSS